MLLDFSFLLFFVISEKLLQRPQIIYTLTWEEKKPILDITFTKTIFIFFLLNRINGP